MFYKHALSSYVCMYFSSIITCVIRKLEQIQRGIRVGTICLKNLAWRTQNSGSIPEEYICRLQNIAMHDYLESVTTGQTNGCTDRQKDRQTPDKVIPMCCYASQATQKLIKTFSNCILLNSVEIRVAVLVASEARVVIFIEWLACKTQTW